MNSARHWTVKTRLWATFVALLLTLAAVGAISIAETRRIIGRAEDIGANALPSVKLLGRFTESLEIHRRLRLSLLAADEQERQRALPRAPQIQARIEASWAAYLPLVTGLEEQQIVNAIAAAWATYRRADAEFVALFEARRIEEAARFFAATLNPAGIALRNALNSAQDFNEAAADRALTISARRSASRSG